MHGSKKWIKDYRGRLKRSNDRTKKDYYAGLKKWDMTYVRNFGWRVNDVRGKDFCPQCKHVQKAVKNDAGRYRALNVEVRQEWVDLYGDRYWVQLDGKTLYFSEYWHNHAKYPGALWTYDYRNFFCYKHERMYEQERAMWDKLPGQSEPYTWQHRYERRKYRAQSKNLMRQERYEDLVPQKKDYH